MPRSHGIIKLGVLPRKPNKFVGAAQKFKLSLGFIKQPKEIMVDTVYEAAEEMEINNVYFNPPF